MTDDPADDRGDGDRADEGRGRPGPSVDSSWLSDLVAALGRLGDASTDDRRRAGRSSFDYSVSVRSGIGVGERSDRGRSDRRSRSTERSRSRRRSASSHHVSTRRSEDELLVTADVSGADPDEIVVGFDDGAVVVGVGDRELERVAVPWDEPGADAVVRNGVLTVTVEPEDGASAGDDPGGGTDE